MVILVWGPPGGGWGRGGAESSIIQLFLPYSSSATCIPAPLSVSLRQLDSSSSSKAAARFIYWGAERCFHRSRLSAVPTCCSSAHPSHPFSFPPSASLRERDAVLQCKKKNENEKKRKMKALTSVWRICQRGTRLKKCWDDSAAVSPLRRCSLAAERLILHTLVATLNVHIYRGRPLHQRPRHARNSPQDQTGSHPQPQACSKNSTTELRDALISNVFNLFDYPGELIQGAPAFT